MKNKLFIIYTILILILISSVFACKTTGKTDFSNDIVGTWEQYVVYEDYNKSLGFFEVVLNGKKYEMKLKNESEIDETKVVKTKGIFNIKYNGSLWTFNSDWGEYGISYLELQKVSDDEFRGYVYLDGKVRSENLWIRVK